MQWMSSVSSRWCQLDRNYYHQISTTTRVVYDTAYSSATAPLWTQTSVAEGQIFDGRASEPERQATAASIALAYSVARVKTWQRRVQRRCYRESNFFRKRLKRFGELIRIANRSALPNGISIFSAFFAGLTSHERYQQTDRPTTLLRM